jgi:hypothetical protein
MTGFAIKLIATFSMLVDHIGNAFGLPFFMRLIGRVAFPLFAFLVAESCTHTKSINKYLRNLAIFAIISHVPFAMMLGIPVLSLRYTNIFFTLFLGTACCACHKKITSLTKNKIFPVIPAIPLVIMGYVLRTDYGWFGVALIFALYLAKNRAAKLGIMFAGMFFLYWFRPALTIAAVLSVNVSDALRGIIGTRDFGFFIASLVALIIFYFYNGKRGREIKMAFYWFYPVHLMVLAVLAFFVV